MTRNSLVVAAVAGLWLVGCAGESVNPGIDPSVDTRAVWIPDHLNVQITERKVFANESTGVSRLEVELAVRNLGYAKRVGLLLSVDGGEWHEAEASYAATEADGFEVWRASYEPAADWRRMEYVAFYEDPVAGHTYWDNSYDNNYEAYPAGGVRHVAGAIDDDGLVIDLKVADYAFDKRCSALATGDDWISKDYLDAQYVGPADEAGWEHWRASVSASDDSWQQYLWRRFENAGRIEYAVSCTFGRDFTPRWDNNGSANYVLDRTFPIADEWSVAHSDADRLAVAPDGQTFVSNGSWLSVYSGQGRWETAVDLGATLIALHYVDEQGVLLARTDNRQWIAVDRALDELWRLSDPTDSYYALQFSRPDGVPVLAGVGGAALVTEQPPELVGPAQGCQGQVIVTGAAGAAGGHTALCRRAGDVAAFDLVSGQHLRSYPDGIPWAASADDGVAVLVDDTRTELVAFDDTGTELWRFAADRIAGDTSPNGSRPCANHADDGLAVATLSPGSYGREIIGFDIATGNQVFNASPNFYLSHSPCPDIDGQFWFGGIYERYNSYGAVLDREGNATRFDYGHNGGGLAVRADGAHLARLWGYFPGSRGRFIVSYGGVETFSRGFDRDADGNEPLPIAALAGDRLVYYHRGAITQLRFR